MRHPVRFAAGVAELLAAPDLILLEVGPGAGLAALARRAAAARGDRRAIVSSLPDRAGAEAGSAHGHLLAALGRLWLAGVAIDWESVAPARGRRVPLPTYPFERRRYWISGRTKHDGAAAAGNGREAPGGRAEGETAGTGSAVWVPLWRQALAPAAPAPAAGADGAAWLVLTDGSDLGAQLLARLGDRRAGMAPLAPTAAVAGPAFARVSERAYIVDPASDADYDALLAAAAGRERPVHAVHLWSLAGDRGAEGLGRLAGALARRGGPARLDVVAAGAVEPAGEPPAPAAAALAGLCRAIAAELPCRLIDLPPSPEPRAAGEARRLAERLAAELLAPRTAGVIALRQGKRWVETWETVDGVPSGDPTLRPGRGYLVVGDLGSPLAAGLLAALASLPARLARVGSGEGGEVAAAAGPACELEPEWLAGRAAELAAALESAESAGPEALDALCGRYALAVLAAAGVEAVPGREIAEDELRRRIALAPGRERLLERLLSMLAEDRAIAREDGIVRFLPAPSPAGPAELRREIEGRSPELAGLCRLLDRAAAALPRVLSGELEGLAVLYPEGSASLFAEVPGDPPAPGEVPGDSPEKGSAVGAGEVPGDSPEPTGARRFAAAGDLPSALLVEALVRAAAAARRAGRPFRVLEAGAGQGLLTRHLLPALETAAGSALQYVFTDLGRSFVLAAERDAIAAGRRGCRFGILDASRDPLAQGYSPGSFDAVVAANVVHATPRVVETLSHLRSLLAPGGVLGLVETVRQHRWNDLVWGLTDGWWSFADSELRTGSPLLAPAAWRGALAAAGFEAAGAFPAAGTAAGAALLLARQPAAAALAGPDALLVPADLADAGALAGAVAEARRRLGALDGAFYVAPASGGGERFAAALPSALAGARAVAAALAGFPPRFLALCAEPGAATALATLAVERVTMPVLALAWGPAAPGLTRLQAALAAALAGGAPVALAPPAVVAGPLQEPGEPAPETSPGEESDGAAAGFHDRPRLVNPYVAPRDEVEQAVAAIWRRALGIDRIGVDDNFLELGGDSLTGLQVAHAVQERWDLAGRAFSLYETPTVSAIARRIAEASGASGEATDHDAEAVPEDRGASRGERRRARRAPARRTEA